MAGFGNLSALLEGRAVQRRFADVPGNRYGAGVDSAVGNSRNYRELIRLGLRHAEVDNDRLGVSVCDNQRVSAAAVKRLSVLEGHAVQRRFADVPADDDAFFVAAAVLNAGNDRGRVDDLTAGGEVDGRGLVAVGDDKRMLAVGRHGVAVDEELAVQHRGADVPLGNDILLGNVILLSLGDIGDDGRLPGIRGGILVSVYTGYIDLKALVNGTVETNDVEIDLREVNLVIFPVVILEVFPRQIDPALTGGGDRDIDGRTLKERAHRAV